MTTIEKLLRRKGPMISSELAATVAQIEKIDLNTASQRVARDKEVLKIKGFFKSNQSLVYLPLHVEDNQVFNILSAQLYTLGLKYWYTLNALNLHNGVISQRYLECYTNYPVLPLNSHIPFNDVMQKFVKQNIVVFSGGDYFLSPKLQSKIPSSVTNSALETVKAYVLETFANVMKNIGMVSFDSAEQFAEYGKFRWAFKGVCPVIGLRGEKDHMGFVLADIIIGVPLYKNDILFFVAKLQHIRSFKNAPRLIPFLIADSLEKEALQYLKKQGIVIGFIHELFGPKYAETLKELLTILNNAAASLKTDPEKYLDLIKQLKIYNEGLLGNIRGTLFEYAVGNIHVVNCQNIEIGREILDAASQRHEMDVLAVYSDRIVIAECKGRKSAVELEDVTHWLDEKIPAFRRWFDKQETLHNKKLEFEFWSTGGFTPEAENELNKVKEEFKKIKIIFFGPKDIRQIAKAMGNKKLKEALDNYFLKVQV